MEQVPYAVEAEGELAVAQVEAVQIKVAQMNQGLAQRQLLLAMMTEISTMGISHRMTTKALVTMVRAIRAYEARTGIRVGYKPAGGISKAKDALVYLSLIKDELGERWLMPDLFRFGASSLLGDIERQLEHHLTGAYSASWRHPMA